MQSGSKYQVSKIPANVPLKLIKAFRDAGENFSELERRLGVNKGILWKLITKGMEPVDEDIRKKVFLPRKVRAPLEAWVRQAVKNLRELEEQAQPSPNRTYNRLGKRVR